MPTVRNPHRREVRYARQASADACAFCRLLAIRPEAQYTTETAALFADNEIGKLYHDECHCTAVPIDPGDTYEMPDYTEQWVTDYVNARDVSDAESFEDVLNYMRRAQYARDNPAEEPEPPSASSPTRRAAAVSMSNVITKSVDAQVKPVDSGDGPGEFEVVLSTDALDRDGENLWPGEWKQPLPERIHIDGDHGRTLEKTVGSAVPRIDEHGRMIGKGRFASTPYAQMVRQLVNEGHINSLSVTYGESKSKDGAPVRELFNAAFVAIPANPEAIVLASKAAKEDDDGSKPYGDVKYADPGYQDDGKARYPIDSADHVRSAWSYINQPGNAGKYSPAELSKVKSRIRAAAGKFDVEIADDKKDGKALAAVLSKQLDASGNNPSPRHDDMVQAIHDAAVALGGQCSSNRTEADTGEDEGANKSATKTSSITKGVGSPQGSPDDSPADAATKAAAHAPAQVPADAAEKSADDAATKAKLAARGRSLAFLIKQTSQDKD